MKWCRISILLLLSTCLIASSCRKEPSLGEILEVEIPKLMEAADIPGMSVAVVREGAIVWSGAFGLRNRDTNEPVDENTIFEAASLTKTITAAAALKLVERGELELDRPLAEYLPYPKLAKDERYKKMQAHNGNNDGKWAERKGLQEKIEAAEVDGAHEQPDRGGAVTLFRTNPFASPCERQGK